MLVQCRHITGVIVYDESDYEYNCIASDVVPAADRNPPKDRDPLEASGLSEDRHLREDRDPLEDSGPSEDKILTEDRDPLEASGPSEDRHFTKDRDPLEACSPFEDRHLTEDRNPPEASGFSGSEIFQRLEKVLLKTEIL